MVLTSRVVPARAIPAHPELVPAKTIGLKSYAVHEAGSVIWLAPQSFADAAGEVPIATALPGGLQATPVRSLYVQAETPVLSQRLQSLLAAPFVNETLTTQCAGGTARQAAWRLDGRELSVDYERIELTAASQAVLVRGEGLAPQGPLHVVVSEPYVLRKADHAMYKAKAAGKRRVCLA